MELPTEQLAFGATLQPIELNGYWVNSVSVEDVEFLELEWQDSSRFIGSENLDI